MKSKNTFFIVNLIMLIIISFFTVSKVVEAKEKIIYIDPGHGGIDGGCITNDGYYEKELVLSIAYYLIEYFNYNGYTTYLTRMGDYDLASKNSKNRKHEDILKRVEIINEKNTLICLSIHANSFSSKAEKGAQVFYHSMRDDSKKLAEAIQNKIKSKLNNTDREICSLDGKYILKNVLSPVVIIEVGFLSNEEEAQLLKASDYQKVLAYTIGEASIEYINEYIEI